MQLFRARAASGVLFIACETTQRSHLCPPCTPLMHIIISYQSVLKAVMSERLHVKSSATVGTIDCTQLPILKSKVT